VVHSTGYFEELTVIFFTDGEDTCSPKEKVLESLQNISAVLRSIPGLNSKFLAIGFSKNHDAAFMNELAKAGSTIGNFIFIDPSKNLWQDEVRVALADCLEIATSNSGPFNFLIENHSISFSKQIAAELTYVYPESEEESKDEEHRFDKV
jgi:hypothetical protein